MAFTSNHARRVLSEEGEERVLAAIREAESKTSGEIRVHIEGRCRKDARTDAARWFELLGMSGTEERNGVLFFLAALDRKFAVIGDEGIHRRVGDEYWARMRDRLEERFRGGDIALGLEEAILEIGRELAAVFPRKPTDANELPDAVSYGTEDEPSS